MRDSPSTERNASERNASERCEVFYSGTVQGVGFRYTVQRLAGGFAVTGFVRNLQDGRVQLIAEGVASELTRFLAAIRTEMSQFIRGAATDRRPATGEFSSFTIRH
jgi:acylphosphatase